MTTNHTVPCCRRGAAAVEFALIAPLMILLVFGMIDVSRALMVQQVLLNAARDGARSASLDGSSRESVEAKIDEYLSAASITSYEVEINPAGPLNEIPAGDPVEVTIRVPFNSVSWLPSSWYFEGVTVQASVVMRRESSSSSDSS